MSHAFGDIIAHLRFNNDAKIKQNKRYFIVIYFAFYLIYDNFNTKL